MIEGKDEENDKENVEKEEEEEEEPKAKTPPKDPKSILKRKKERDQHGDADDQGKKKKVKFEKDLEEELGKAMEENYEVKFSTEIFLPMRKRRDMKKASWEAGCPIDLNSKTNDDDAKVKATWPDGFETELIETYGDLRKLMPSGSRSMEIVGSKLILEETHKATKNIIKLDQRVDRHLLIAMYENGRQILQNRVDEFGPCANENQRLPETDKTLLKAYAFMKPIFDSYVKDEISKDELIPLRNKMLAERKEKKTEGKAASKKTEATSTKTEATSKASKATSNSSGSNEASTAAGPSKGIPRKPTRSIKAEEKKPMVIDDSEDNDTTESEAQGAKAKVDKKSMKIKDLGIKLPPILSSLETFEIFVSDPDA